MPATRLPRGCHCLPHTRSFRAVLVPVLRSLHTRYCWFGYTHTVRLVRFTHACVLLRCLSPPVRGYCLPTYIYVVAHARTVTHRRAYDLFVLILVTVGLRATPAHTAHLWMRLRLHLYIRTPHLLHTRIRYCCLFCFIVTLHSWFLHVYMPHLHARILYVAVYGRFAVCCTVTHALRTAYRSHGLPVHGSIPHTHHSLRRLVVPSFTTVYATHWFFCHTCSLVTTAAPTFYWTHLCHTPPTHTVRTVLPAVYVPVHVACGYTRTYTRCAVLRLCGSPPRGSFVPSHILYPHSYTTPPSVAGSHGYLPFAHYRSWFVLRIWFAVTRTFYAFAALLVLGLPPTPPGYLHARVTYYRSRRITHCWFGLLLPLLVPHTSPTIRLVVATVTHLRFVCYLRSRATFATPAYRLFFVYRTLPVCGSRCRTIHTRTTYHRVACGYTALRVRLVRAHWLRVACFTVCAFCGYRTCTAFWLRGSTVAGSAAVGSPPLYTMPHLLRLRLHSVPVVVLPRLPLLPSTPSPLLPGSVVRFAILPVIRLQRTLRSYGSGRAAAVLRVLYALHCRSYRLRFTVRFTTAGCAVRCLHRFTHWLHGCGCTHVRLRSRTFTRLPPPHCLLHAVLQFCLLPHSSARLRLHFATVWFTVLLRRTAVHLPYCTPSLPRSRAPVPAHVRACCCTTLLPTLGLRIKHFGLVAHAHARAAHCTGLLLPLLWFPRLLFTDACHRAARALLLVCLTAAFFAVRRAGWFTRTGSYAPFLCLAHSAGLHLHIRCTVYILPRRAGLVYAACLTYLLPLRFAALRFAARLLPLRAAHCTPPAGIRYSTFATSRWLPLRTLGS